jgi:hypothetical protein
MRLILAAWILLRDSEASACENENRNGARLGYWRRFVAAMANKQKRKAEREIERSAAHQSN